jgi:hypothetical protein
VEHHGGVVDAGRVRLRAAATYQLRRRNAARPAGRTGQLPLLPLLLSVLHRRQ